VSRGSGAGLLPEVAVRVRVVATAAIPAAASPAAASRQRGRRARRGAAASGWRAAPALTAASTWSVNEAVTGSVPVLASSR
jgi:hypothetical protein